MTGVKWTRCSGARELDRRPLQFPPPAVGGAGAPIRRVMGGPATLTVRRSRTYNPPPSEVGTLSHGS